MESIIVEKLRLLTKLQSIDSKLNEMKKIRNTFPEEVMDLEDEVVGFETRIAKYNQNIEDLDFSITNDKNSIKNFEKLIEKYVNQQMNVRNNREYNAIIKETELQKLEIQLVEKKIKDSHSKIESIKKEIVETSLNLEERIKDLEVKKSDLKVIISDSEDNEAKLIKSRIRVVKTVEKRLLIAYDRIRSNMKNELAVVFVQRDACGGCFNIVPPQMQAEVRDKKKLIVCEHCGRILADVEEVIVKEVKKTKSTRKITTKKAMAKKAMAKNDF